MSGWRDLGRTLLGSPQRVAFAVLAAATAVAVYGLATTVGVEVHPAVGWFVALACVGWPATWLGRALYNERITAAAAAARAAHGRDDGVPADMRGDSGPGGRVRSIDRDRDDEEGAPGRTW